MNTTSIQATGDEPMPATGAPPAGTTEPIIVARGLTKVFQDGVAFPALDGIDLTVRRGEFIAIMGPSGSGKSTLLHLLGALERPTAGHLMVAGQDLVRLRDLAGFRGRTVGLVFQLHNLLPTLTALENVEVPMMDGARSRTARRARAWELLHLVGLAAVADHRPPELSGGQRQRVALARALANEPPLILADEPTGNLDTRAGAEVLALLRQLNEERGVTVVLVTHDPLLAVAAQRVITLRDGRIVEDRLMTATDRAALESLRATWLGRLILVGA
jgi:ABC-type lipoprotein export system ATPase subunit